MSEQFVTTTKHFRKLLAAGYLLIVLLVGGIICTWLGEWRDLELLERENREINRFRKETHDAYVGVVELSLLGESVLEWDDKDVAAYRPTCWMLQWHFSSSICPFPVKLKVCTEKRN